MKRFNNMIVNGNFDVPWQYTAADHHVSDGEGVYTATSMYGRIYKSPVSTLTSHKYYIKIKVKADSSSVIATIPGRNTSRLSHSGSGSYETLSDIINGAVDGNTSFRVQDNRTSDWTEVRVKEALIVDLTQEYGAGNEPNLEEFENILNEHEDNAKKIVWFGDSIVEGSGGLYRYTPLLEQRLEAKVYNAGFGGTRMSSHSSPAYDAFSMYRLAEAIVSKDWSLQTNHLSAVPASYQDQLNNLRNIDFSKISAIGLAYGTNDFGGDKPISSSDNQLSTYHYINAARYAIDKILTVYPHIKIVLLTPTWRARFASGDTRDSDKYPNGIGEYLHEYVDALLEFGKEIKVPVLDMFYDNFINKYNHTLYLRDGLHPTELGAEMIGNKVASFLESKLTL